MFKKVLIGAGVGVIARLISSASGISLLLHGTGLLFRLTFLIALLHYTNTVIVGQFALAASIEVVAVYISGLEFHTFTARRYARRGTFRHLRLMIWCHRRVLIYTTPVTVIATLCIVKILDYQISIWNLIALLVIITTSAITQEIGRYLLLARQPIASAILSFIRNSAWQPLAIPFLGAGPSSLSAIFGLWATFSILSLFWGVWVLRKYLNVHARPRFMYLLAGIQKAKGYYGIAVSSVLQANMERFILQLMLGSSAVGIFSFFQTLANTIPGLVQSAVINIEMPKLLEQFGRKMQGRFVYIAKIVWHVVFVVAALSLMIWGLAEILILLLKRPEYISALWILPVLLTSQAITTITQPLHLAVYAAHQDRPLVILMAAGLIVSLIINTMLIKVFGLVGAVTAPLLVGVGIGIGRVYLLRRIMRTERP